MPTRSLLDLKTSSVKHDMTEEQVPCSPRMHDYQLKQRKKAIQPSQPNPIKYSADSLPTHNSRTTPHHHPTQVPVERSHSALGQAKGQPPKSYPRKHSEGELPAHNKHTPPRHGLGQVHNNRSTGTLGLILNSGARKGWIPTGVTSVKSALRNKRLSYFITEHGNQIIGDASQASRYIDLICRPLFKESYPNPLPAYNAFQHVGRCWNEAYQEIRGLC